MHRLRKVLSPERELAKYPSNTYVTEIKKSRLRKTFGDLGCQETRNVGVTAQLLSVPTGRYPNRNSFRYLVT
jgi:hypothetical protein